MSFLSNLADKSIDKSNRNCKHLLNNYHLFVLSFPTLDFICLTLDILDSGATVLFKLGDRARFFIRNTNVLQFASIRIIATRTFLFNFGNAHNRRFNWTTVDIEICGRARFFDIDAYVAERTTVAIVMRVAPLFIAVARNWTLRSTFLTFGIELGWLAIRTRTVAALKKEYFITLLILLWGLDGYVFHTCH